MTSRTLRLPDFDFIWWLIPVAALVLLLGIEVDWGQHSARSAALAPAAFAPPAARPVDAALLPEYAIAGGVESRRETAERTLFNPTRRPAPVPVQEVAKPQMPRGQFALTGTTVVEGKSTAFLREVNGGKARRVREGDTLNGLLVAEVKPDRVKLTMGGESEDLVLRVAGNSRPTPIPAVPPPTMAGPAGAVVGSSGAATQESGSNESLIERRRAARAAAIAAQNAAAQNPTQNAATANAVAAPATPAPIALPGGPPPAPGQPRQPPAGWSDVFQQYQQRYPTTTR